MHRTLTKMVGLPDDQLVDLLRYALALKARIGLATAEDTKMLGEILFYVDPKPKIEAMQVA